jgi:hypothetical protein
MMNNHSPAKGLFFLKTAFLTMLLLLSLPPSLPAQNRRYVTEQRFTQRLAWVGDEYVFRYEVVIERDEGQGYYRYRKESAETPELRVSLPLGNYRYQVIPYDFLDQPGEASDWITLDVYAPPVTAVETQDTPPSGYEKQIDIYLGAAWSPIFPLYGGMQQIFGQKLYFSGATIRLGLVFTQPQFLNPGLELSTSWYALDTAFDTDKIEIQAGVMDLNILIQKWLPNRKMAFMLRAGGGLSFQIGDISSGQEVYFLDRIAPHINVELSFLWLALKQFYVEGGLNLTHFLNQSESSGYLRPEIGIGWQF